MIEERYSVNIHFLVVFDINLDVTIYSLLAGGVFCCPSGLACIHLILTQEAQLMVRFTLYLAVYEIQGCKKSEMH